MLGGFRELLFETSRQKRRKRLGRSLLADIFWYSGVYDYRILRMLINFPVGFGISIGVYTLAWNRLNFADFDDKWREIFKWSMICASALTYAISPVFRCATICAIIGAIGKSGQGLMSVFVLDQLTSGPVANIMSNFEITSSIIVCQLEQQSKITAQRVTLATGPIEELFEKHFGRAASMGRKFVYSLKALMDPLNQELQSTENEDEALAAELDNAQAMSERESIIEGVSVNQTLYEENLINEHLRPAWTKYKSHLGRNYYRRMSQRCKLIYANAATQCIEKMEGLKKKCLDSVPIVGSFICPDLNPLEMCKPTELLRKADKGCDFGKENDQGPGLDDQMEMTENISATLRHQLALNMHFKAIEEPRFEGMQALADIKTEIKSSMNYFKVVIATVKELISTLMIYFVYSIFRDTVQMISNYLTNIEFKNTFLTSYFWYIDRKRQLLGQPHLAPLTNAEKKRNGLMSPFGFPTSVEIKQSWMPLLKWSIVVVIVSATLLVDHYVYRIFHHLADTRTTYEALQGNHTLEIGVEGEGPIAELLKEILNFNYTKTVDFEVDNDACASQPQAPNWDHTATWILGPLFVMFMLQVVFNFVIRRTALFFIVGYIFRKRSKARIVQLYNKLLFARVNERRLARARIRCAVERRLLQRAEDKGVMHEESFLRRRIIDVLFKTGKCLLCEVKFRPRSLVNCRKCTATYCRTCYEELRNQCYACLAEEGAVDSQVTQLRGP